MNVFDAGVTIHLVDRVSGGLAHVAQSMTRTATAATALQNRLNKISSTFQSGLIMAGGGMALAMPLIGAVKSAMHLETALARVKIQTHASTEQMKMLNDTFTKTSNSTGIFSKPKIAGFAAEMFSMGIRDIKQINSLLPGFAKAADVTQLMSGGRLQADGTLHALVALAHQFGAYTPGKMQPISEAAVSLGKALPGGLSSLASTGASVNIIGRKLGIDEIDLMSFQAAVAQTSGSKGAGGRGGLSAANQANFLKRSMPGALGNGVITGSSGFAAAVLGLGDKYGATTVMRNGKMDFDLYQNKIAAFQKLSGQQIGKLMLDHVHMLSKKKLADIYPLIARSQVDGGKHVNKDQLLMKLLGWQYGSAATVALLAGDATFRGQQKSMAAEARKDVKEGGIERMQKEVMKTLDAQLQRTQTNMTTLSSTIGMQLIPVLTPLVTKFGDFLDQANQWAEAHPKMIQMAAGALAAVSALLILGGSIRILHAGFMGLQLLFGPLGLVFRGLASNAAFAWKILGPLATLIGPRLGGAGMFALRFLGPVGIALTILGLVLYKSGAAVKFMNQHSRFFIHIAAEMVRAGDKVNECIKTLIGWFGSLANAIGRLIGSVAGMIGRMPIAGNAGANLGAIGSGVQNTGAALGRLGASYMKNWLNVDDLAAKRDEKLLGEKSYGAALMAGIKGKAAPVVVHQKIDVHVKQVPGHDHEKCAATLTKKLARGAGQAMSASSGNSIGRSNRQGGATRS